MLYFRFRAQSLRSRFIFRHFLFKATNKWTYTQEQHKVKYVIQEQLHIHLGSKTPDPALSGWPAQPPVLNLNNMNKICVSRWSWKVKTWMWLKSQRVVRSRGKTGLRCGRCWLQTNCCFIKTDNKKRVWYKTSFLYCFIISHLSLLWTDLTQVCPKTDKTEMSICQFSKLFFLFPCLNRNVFVCVQKQGGKTDVVQLCGAVIEWTTEKSSRKNVFQVTNKCTLHWTWGLYQQMSST